jgi:hypothetical protein
MNSRHGIPTRTAETSSGKGRKECRRIPTNTRWSHVSHPHPLPLPPLLVPLTNIFHPPSSPPTSHDPAIPDINNDKSLGAEIKHHLQEAKDEATSTIQHAKDHAKTEVAPKKAWWGLGMFGASQGGEESPREGGKTN